MTRFARVNVSHDACLAFMDTADDFAAGTILEFGWRRNLCFHILIIISR